MYKYDTYDQAIVDARVEDFRDQVARRLAGDISEDQFKPLRLMNGLYLQLHAYMLRVAIPYGTMDSRQMHMLAHIARKYDRGYGHFTTRQNIQYNWIKLAECPDLLADLATVEMHAIQTSGNCIRNISSDQYAGAAADEVTRASGPKCSANGQASTPNSAISPASSKSRSSPARKTAQRCASTTSASKWSSVTAYWAVASSSVAAWAAPR
jgi:sulfite reductase beta subunit-like hemoprotein